MVVPRRPARSAAQKTTGRTRYAGGPVSPNDESERASARAAASASMARNSGTDAAPNGGRSTQARRNGETTMIPVKPPRNQ